MGNTNGDSQKAGKKQDTKDELFLRNIHKDKKLKLSYLHEQHQIAIAVYNARKEALISDIDILEKHLNYVDYSK